MSRGRTADAEQGLNASPERYFREAYDDVMYTGAVGRYSAWMHRVMERPYRGTAGQTILEVGAGAGQHAEYVTGPVAAYWETDLDVDLNPVLAREVNGFTVQRRVADAQDLAEFADDSVDRVIATCLLAHLSDMEAALREWRRVVRPGGHVVVYVPAEPGFLLRCARRMVMVPKGRKHGQDHLRTVYRDHRNHYPAMRMMIEDVFAGDAVRRRRYPLAFLGWNFSLFDIFHITKAPEG